MGSAGHMQPHKVCAAVHFLSIQDKFKVFYLRDFKSLPHFHDSWRTAVCCILFSGFAGYKVHKVKRAVQ